MGGPGTAEAQLPLLYQISYLHSGYYYTLCVSRERERASVIICLSESAHRRLETQQSNAIRHQQWKPKERCLKESVGLTQSRSVSALSVFLHCRRSLFSAMTGLRFASIGARAATGRQLGGPTLLATPVRSPRVRLSDCQEGRQLFAHWQPG